MAPGAHFLQRALGRLLSAAREPAPTQHGSVDNTNLLPAPTKRTPGTNGRKVSMPRTITPATRPRDAIPDGTAENAKTAESI
jgi:hypothetical protein